MHQEEIETVKTAFFALKSFLYSNYKDYDFEEIKLFWNKIEKIDRIELFVLDFLDKEVEEEFENIPLGFNNESVIDLGFHAFLERLKIQGPNTFVIRTKFSKQEAQQVREILSSNPEWFGDAGEFYKKYIKPRIIL